jgi:hypothetical protein
MSSLALLAALCAPAAADGLSLTGARLSHGVLGPDRADSKYLPGDTLVLSFDISGLAIDPQGKVRYSMASACANAKGEAQFHQPARESDAVNVLGGDRLPAYARVDVGLQQPPGDYSLTITVTDLATRKSATLTQKFTVLPKAFAVVALHASADKNGEHPAGLLGVGQAAWLSGHLVGFERDPKTKAPGIELELRVLDEGGKPTLEKPFARALDTKDVPATAAAIPIQFLGSLNRPGKFTVELKAKDTVSGKSYTALYPLHVLPR